MMRTCKDCKQEFPKSLEYFFSAGIKNGKQYLHSQCKSCSAIRMKVYRRENKEKMSIWKSNYYQKNKERVDANNKRWELRHPEKVKSFKRIKSARRRAKKKGNGWEPYTEEQMISKYGSICYLCNEEIDLQAPRQCGKPGWERSFWIEHVIAIDNGGPDTLDNVRPSHALCNLNKGTKEIYETA